MRHLRANINYTLVKTPTAPKANRKAAAGNFSRYAVMCYKISKLRCHYVIEDNNHFTDERTSFTVLWLAGSLD
ncbi:hypothetical protein ALQ35_200007 [Pseudomonas fluorescens]|nr:hypothetical protein ALQ35_200007 [Pseudomonas fluorescens]